MTASGTIAGLPRSRIAGRWRRHHEDDVKYAAPSQRRALAGAARRAQLATAERRYYGSLRAYAIPMRPGYYPAGLRLPRMPVLWTPLRYIRTAVHYDRHRLHRGTIAARATSRDNPLVGHERGSLFSWRADRARLAEYRRRRAGRSLRRARARLMSVAISSRSTAAVDSRSSHSAIGNSVSLAKLRAKARVDCARGPSEPSMLIGRPSTKPTAERSAASASRRRGVGGEMSCARRSRLRPPVCGRDRSTATPMVLVPRSRPSNEPRAGQRGAISTSVPIAIVSRQPGGCVGIERDAADADSRLCSER